jgi:catechol 2,3-dioxygenase-like lactoylglutathione lyase family enzyme
VAYLHTMYRITDPERSRPFYQALGFEFRRELLIVRDGELEATNYFFGVPWQDEELELTYNHDGRTYDLGTGYGHRDRRRRPGRDAGAAAAAGDRARARPVHGSRRRLAFDVRERS